MDPRNGGGTKKASKIRRRWLDKGPSGQRRKHFVNSAYYINTGTDKNCQYYVEQARLLRGALI